MSNDREPFTDAAYWSDSDHAASLLNAVNNLAADVYAQDRIDAIGFDACERLADLTWAMLNGRMVWREYAPFGGFDA